MTLEGQILESLTITVTNAPTNIDPDEEPPPVTVTATPAGATFSYVRRF